MGDRELKIIAAAFVAFCLFAGAIVAYVLRSDFRSAERSKPDLAKATDRQTAEQVQAEVNIQRETTERYGRVWEFRGRLPHGQWGDANPLCIGVPDVSEWIDTVDPDSRLLVFTPPESNRTNWAKITYKQVRQNGEWKNHGFERTVYSDGRIAHHETKYGVMHGLEQWWAPNGQLIKECTNVDGKRHGEAKGWYEDGAPEYIAVYRNDVEVSGTSWAKDGSLVGKPKVENEVPANSITLKELKRSSIGDLIRTFDYQITNNTASTLENVQIQVVCKTLADKYLGSTKVSLPKLGVGESEIVKAMVEADVEAHELTDITIVGEHRNQISIHFVP